MAITTAMISTAAIVVSIVSAVVSTAIGVTSAVIQGNQQKAMANYQRKVNEQNAQASRQAAQAKIENQRRSAKFTYGTQLARLGGMGALTEGSPLDIMGQSAGQEKYDELVTEYEGETQAIQFQQKAALNKYQADVAGYNIGLNTSVALVKGVGSISNSLLGVAGSLGSAGTLTGSTPNITNTASTVTSSGYAGTLPSIGK